MKGIFEVCDNNKEDTMAYFCLLAGDYNSTNYGVQSPGTKSGARKFVEVYSEYIQGNRSLAVIEA